MDVGPDLSGLSSSPALRSCEDGDKISGFINGGEISD
jgi:hypothetical protein